MKYAEQELLEKYIDMKQSILQKHGDKRQINEVWKTIVRDKEKYLFGRVGGGKNSYIVTIAYYNHKRRKWELA